MEFDIQKTAVLIMDYQNDIVKILGGAPEPLLARADKVLSAARSAGPQIIHVVIGFREHYPEIGPRNKNFSSLKQSNRFKSGDEGTHIHREIKVYPEDIRVTKHRVSAFAGSDLEMILRARQFETLVLFGIATSGVVLSTVRQAADLDYGLVVIADCCADPDEEVHRVLTEKIFPKQADVFSAEQFLEVLGRQL